MQRIGLFAAWLVATLVATAGAWQVVGAAESEVFDAPLTPVIAISSSSTTATAPRESVSTFETPSTVADPVPGSTPTTITASSGSTADQDITSSTASGENGTVSSTTSPSPSTTPVPATGVPTTTGPSDGGDDPGEPGEPRSTLSVPTQAGTVTAAGNADDVDIVAVLPAPGWSYEVADDDDRVRVTFRRGENELRVEIRWDGDRLVADIER